mgnify:CR=1 FL=1
MVEFTEEQLKRLHKSGATLSKAWLFYAHPDLKSQWEELQKKSAVEAFQSGIEKADAMDGDAMTKLYTALSGSQAILVARGELADRLKANILSYISNGHLHGFGYERPRHLSSAPVAIPKAAWAGKCDWAKDTLSYKGLEFSDVRLTTNRIRNEVLERGVVDKSPTSPAGRPGVGPAIEAAFHALHAAGEINPKESQSSHYPKVRAWLELHHPNLSVPPASLSKKTIYRYFSPLFKGL